MEELATGLDKWVHVGLNEIISYKDKFWLVCETPERGFNIEVRHNMDAAEDFLGGTFEESELFIWVKGTTVHAITFDKQRILMISHKIA